MAVDHVQVALVDRQVDRLAQGPATVVEGVARVGELHEVAEVLDRRVAPAAVQVVDERRAVGRDEHEMRVADDDRARRVAGALGERARRGGLDERAAQPALEAHPLAVDVGSGPPEDLGRLGVVDDLDADLLEEGVGVGLDRREALLGDDLDRGQPAGEVGQRVDRAGQPGGLAGVAAAPHGSGFRGLGRHRVTIPRTLSAVTRPAAPPLLVLAGATATGKTGLAVRLGRALQAEGRPVTVISADSRQVYRGLDIGTAKASLEERGTVPHAGLDLVDPPQRFTVTDFVHHATAVLDDLAARGGVAILAGGTGLYLRAVARGLAVDDLPTTRRCGPRSRPTWPATGSRRWRAGSSCSPRPWPRPWTWPTRAGWCAPWSWPCCAATSHDPSRAGTPGRVAWIGLQLEPDEHRRRIAERARGQFAAGLVEEAVAPARALGPEPAVLQRDRLCRGLVGRRRASRPGRGRSMPTRPATSPSPSVSGRGSGPSPTSPGWTRPRATPMRTPWRRCAASWTEVAPTDQPHRRPVGAGVAARRRAPARRRSRGPRTTAGDDPRRT